MIPCEFGKGTRRLAGQVSDDAGNGHCFSPGSLISTDGEDTFDDSW
jgi:hypothetical protein